MLFHITQARCIKVLCSFVMVAFLLQSIHAELDESSPYFNTSFLIHYDQVTSHLIKDGFKEIYFNAEDQVKLNGLWLNRNDASCNVILCCGFYPGRKEGLAAFYHLLPETCNILLFDARGHGKSEGRFLSKLAWYGAHEYKDIIGALSYIREHNDKPICIIGICAGAYHTVKAAHHLQKNGNYNLMPAGIVLDSSILSIPEAYTVPKKYFIYSILPNMLRKTIYAGYSKTTVKESWLYTICTWCTIPLLTAVEYALYPYTLLRDDQLDIREHLLQLTVPVYLIHAQNDTFASCKLIQECSTYASGCWWPSNAEHACIYLQHKNEYCARLHTFIADIV